jgi:hypothetical protein
MIAISNTGRTHQSPANRAATKWLWREVGLGLGAALIGLTMTVAGIQGKSGPEVMAWQAQEAQRAVGGWEYGVPIDLLPLGVLPPDTSR